MHWPGHDNIHADCDPLGLDDKPGWAYGAFLLNRSNKWDPQTCALDLYYLLSLSFPYRVQVMHSRLLIPWVE